MKTALRPSWKLVSPLPALILTGLVAIVCYQADRLVYVLGIPPEHIASFWPATPFLVAVLLLVSRRIWPVLIAAGLAAMALADLKNGVTIGSEIWITLGNLVDVFVALLGISLLFKGAPYLDNVKAAAKYLTAGVIPAPFVSALLGANSSSPGGYWLQWRVWFFADALAFLTVTPAILSWVREGRAWTRKSSNYLELAALLTSLALLGYLAFMVTWRRDSPALLYLLVPLLLWATLRLGIKGVSTSMLVIAFLAIWGASRDRGPFTGQGPLNNALSLQLFLFFAAMPFMALAALVEEKRRTQQKLADEHAQLAEAQRLAQVGSWHWDRVTDTVTWSEELYRIAGRSPHLQAPNYKEHGQLYTPESWERLQRAVEESLRTGGAYELDLEMVRPNGTTIWVTARGEVRKDDTGRIVSLHGTVRDITERRRAEGALRESEQRFRLVANTAPVLIWMSGPNKFCNYFNQSWLEFTGRPLEAELGDGWTEGVHPEDLGRCLNTYSSAFDRREPFKMEYRLRRHDGEYRWVLDAGVPRLNADGSFAGYIGSAVDVTERRKAEEVLSGVSRRLIEAQEQERTRIARDLHDDIGQRLALLMVELHQMKEVLPDFATDLRSGICELEKKILEMSIDIQSLSHELHSPRLEYLGIVAAVKGFCREFGDKYKVKVDFAHDGIPRIVSPEVSLCVFRILQEALHNALKHSGQRSFQVKLQGSTTEILLTVLDSGAGFNPVLAGNSQGLGLISMRERVNIVNGSLLITSGPQCGTEVSVRVPISAGPQTAQGKFATP